MNSALSSVWTWVGFLGFVGVLLGGFWVLKVVAGFVWLAGLEFKALLGLEQPLYLQHGLMVLAWW